MSRASLYLALLALSFLITFTSSGIDRTVGGGADSGAFFPKNALSGGGADFATRRASHAESQGYRDTELRHGVH